MNTKMTTKTNTLLSATIATTLFAALSTSQVAMANESVLDLTQAYISGETVKEAERVNFSVDSSDVAQGYSAQDSLTLDKSDVFTLTQSYFQGK